MTSPNAASEQVANGEAATDGGAALISPISERMSPRLSVEVKCSSAVMQEQCAEPAGLTGTRRNVPTDKTDDGSNRQEAFEGASSEMRAIRPRMSTEAPMLVERNVCREHADDSVQATVRPYEVNTEDIVATEKAPGERGVQSNGSVMMALDSAGDTVPTIDTEQIMIREHASAIISTWCGIGSSPTAQCTGTVPNSLCAERLRIFYHPDGGAHERNATPACHHDGCQHSDCKGSAYGNQWQRGQCQTQECAVEDWTVGPS